MGIVSPGFSGRRRDANEKLPPGQYLVTDFPVLSAGPTPRVHTGSWEFSITTETGQVHRWDWATFQALPSEDADGRPALRDEMVEARHPLARGCPWTRCSADVETSADFALAHSYGGYTTNLPLEDLLDGQAWVAYRFRRRAAGAEHGGPARLLVPHLYLWKSAKWVRGITLSDRGRAGVLGERRLSQLRGPVARAAVLGRLTWRVGTSAATTATRPPPRARLVLDVPGWPGHLAGQHVDVRLTAPDGYSTARSYSIASAPDGGRRPGRADRAAGAGRRGLAVPDRDASAVGDPVEIRGPVGGWFVWRTGRTAPGRCCWSRAGPASCR